MSGLGPVDRQRLPAVAEHPQIIEAHDVIRVGVRDQHGIHAPDVFPQRLLAEIRPGIHDPRAFRRLDVGGGAGAFVARVGRAADRAIAGHQRDALRGAGAEKGESEIAHEGGGISGIQHPTFNIEHPVLIRLRDKSCASVVERAAPSRVSVGVPPKKRARSDALHLPDAPQTLFCLATGSARNIRHPTPGIRHSSFVVGWMLSVQC